MYKSTHLATNQDMQCAACGDTLVGHYYVLRDRPERYCERCIQTRPRCASCGAPVAVQHWRLHDGRLQCSRCHATAIYDPAIARQIYDETVVAIVAQLQLQLKYPVAFRLVDAPTFEQLRTDDIPASHGDLILGMYRRIGAQRVIYMLYGLPRMTFRLTVAHEYAHAWQAENCPLLTNEALREGFAEWVAYRHLLYLGCSRAARQLRTTPHPYLPYLESMLAIDAHGGPTSVIHTMLTACVAP
jgi:hypothetical protein